MNRSALRRRVAIVVGIVLGLFFVGLTQAIAYWIASDSGSHAAASSGSLPAPSAPSVSVASGTVDVSWSVSTASNGANVTGYSVMRYPAASGGTATPATGGCAGVVTTLACTETDLPSGTWYYTVTAHLHSWTGSESPRSSGAAVVATTFSVMANQLVSSLPGEVTGGTLSGFAANESVDFRLDSAGGAVLVASPSAVDSSGNATGVSLTVPAGTADGLHAIVAVGGAGSQATSNPFRIDTTGPAASYAHTPAPNAAGWNNANVTLALSATDTGGAGVASITYSTGGGDTTVPGATTNVVISTEGTTTVSFFATDVAGNSGAPTSRTVKLDKTAPSSSDNTATITNAWKNTAQTVVLTTSDTGSGIDATYFTTNGTTPTTSSSSGSSISLATDGSFTVKYFSVDVAGNVEVVRTAGTVIRIDLTVPAAGSLSVASFVKNGATLAFNVAPVDPGGAAASGLASVTFSFCSGASCTPTSAIGSPDTDSPYSVVWGSQPADGSYRIQARVVDAAGNASLTPIVSTTVDNSAPTGLACTAVHTNGVNFSISGAATTATGDLPTVSLTAPPSVSFNNASPTVTSNQWSTTGDTAKGTFTITVSRSDSAGNTSSATCTLTR